MSEVKDKDTAKKLLALKEMIDEAKDKKTEFSGELKGIMKELKDKWNCPTLQKATDKNDEKAKELKKLNTQFDEYMAELEEKYEL